LRVFEEGESSRAREAEWERQRAQEGGIMNERDAYLVRALERSKELDR